MTQRDDKPNADKRDNATLSEVGDQELPVDTGRDATPADQPSVQKVLDKLQAERDDLESRLLRVSADYQNFVRRSQQNIAAARDQEVMAMAKALVNVLDHFDSALGVDPQKTKPADLLQGVQIVRDELLKTLEGFGVRRLDVVQGEEFDPTRHEAMLRQHVEGLDPNHVAAQFQPGYVLGDKTVRPAKVSVTE
jgi:molecular chaperone GrpE